MINIRFIFIILLLINPAIGYSKNDTIFEVVNDAMIASERLSISRNDLERASNNVKQNFGKMVLPTLNFSREKVQYNSTVENSQRGYVDKETATLSYTLFNGFRDYLNFKNSGSQKLIKYIEFKEVVNRVIKSSMTNYIRLMSAKKKVNFYETNLKRMKHEREKAKIERQARLISNAEFLRRDVGYQKANDRLIRANSSYDSLKEQFIDIAGRKPTGKFISPNIKNIFIFKNREEVIKYAKDNSPVVIKALLRLKTEKSSLNISKSAFLPTLSFSASEYESSALEYESSRDVSLTFTWNLFNGGSDFYNIKNQKLSYKNAILRYKETLSKLEHDISRTWREYQDKLRNYKNRLSILKASKLLYEAETIRTFKGISTVSDYLKANSDYLKATDDVANAKDEIDFVMIDLLLKTGYLRHSLISAL